ncbi:MAG: helix-hairpin-helix domain-containing protein [Wenyingzhuangia sp.]|uniref:ComEA family DNA-binding protein n=1 Tax=Wenyingzhuangia sp. TaxID=1964193 RepID=UPI00321A209C
MKQLKTHFRYSKSQRNGFFLFLLIVVLIEVLLWGLQKSSQGGYEVEAEVLEIQSALEGIPSDLRQTKFKIYPFNPNYLSDYKAYQLGMSVKEIDRLMAFRKSGQYINSSIDFQKVTKISDSLLACMTPYFKFPSWSIQKKPKLQKIKRKPIIVKDINVATVEALKKVSGIGEKRAKSIIKYRKLLGGYTYDLQLKEIWGIPEDVLIRLQREFKVLSHPNLKKINVNIASVYELSKIVYIDYKLAKSIVEYRAEVAEIQNLAELKTIRDFPHDKFNLISLYLHAY